MNTTKKGSRFEKQVYDLISNIINRDEFLVRKEFCKIFLQKKYFSKDRGKDIIFDVAVEAYLPGQEKYSMLFLIECKNYNHKVPVDDVEEFYAKTQQISSTVKPIIASTNSFQEGALNFSRSKGIGLFRYYNPQDLTWELTRSPSSFFHQNYNLLEWLTVSKGILDQDHKSQYFDFYGYTNNKYTNSIYLFFKYLIEQSTNEIEKIINFIKNNAASNSLVKYRSKQEIESFCTHIYKIIDYKDGEVPLKKVNQWLLENYNLQIINTQLSNKNILGKIKFRDLKIYINTDNKNYHRRKFTICHEIGHYILGHQAYTKSEECSEPHLNLETPQSIAIKDIMMMEFQANYFASCLLLPRKNFIRSFFDLTRQLELKNRGYGTLYLDSQPCNIDSFYKITFSLMNTYVTSRSVIKIRLKDLGLLKEEAQPLQLLRDLA